MIILTCSVNDCDRTSNATFKRGMCTMHYQRWLKRDQVGRVKRTNHGYQGTPTYRTWRAMKQRCHDPNARTYVEYGARGIAVCARWRDSFLAFLSDMGERPTGMTIDRVDITGNYEPNNCRWATYRQQVHNRRPHGASRFRGVQKYNGTRPWRAGILPASRRFINLGTFNNEHEAALAWNFAAFFVYGEDYTPNVIVALPAETK